MASTPVGTLADFLEVSGEHEGVVDEFLREELNYVVVKSWGAAEEGVRVLKSGVDGRATFLIHDPTRRLRCSTRRRTRSTRPGVTPLKDAIKVLNGFGRSLETILPKLRHGYLVENGGAGAATGERAYACILPDAGGRVLPQRDGDRRQAGERRSAGAEARTARDGDAAGTAGARSWQGGDWKRRR